MLGRIRIRSGGEHDHRRWEQNFYCLQNSLLFSGSRLCRFCVTRYDCGMRVPGFMLPLSEAVLPVSANSSEKISPVSGSCVCPDILFSQLKIVNIYETGRQKPSPPIRSLLFPYGAAFGLIFSPHPCRGSQVPLFLIFRHSPPGCPCWCDEVRVGDEILWSRASVGDMRVDVSLHVSY